MISPVTVDSLNLHYKSELRFRLGIPDKASNIEGMTVFGHGFGNYNQGIRFRMIYCETEDPEKSGTENGKTEP